jgi:ketosteroid isomerase-like protein
MRYAVASTALALTVVLSACATGAKGQEFTRADAEAIRQTAVELTAAFNAKQIDKVLALYADNSTFMPPNAPVLRGREPLKSFFSDLLASGTATLEMHSEEVGGHGPLAYESGTYSIVYGATSARDRGKYLRLLRNSNGSWRTEKTIWSSDLPPAQHTN